MSDSPQTIRIFISSPGDVVEERDRVRRVIEGLQRHYPDLVLKPVLWEDLALPATASFQESIDFLLQQEPIDVAVFILWSRLGSPLGSTITKPNGTLYRSGTEREFDLMLAAFEQSQRKRPIILAYARDDDLGFRHKLLETPAAELEELIAQRQLAEAFIRERFYDEEGHNLRALQSYREPVSFTHRVRVHLRHALDSFLGTDAAPRWLVDPYRGLQVFGSEHAVIFHGRDEETLDVLQRMQDQREAGCSFVCIVGASGSGKSSLARAGVAASLAQHSNEQGVKHWRVGTLVPSLREKPTDRQSDRDGAGLCAALAGTLAGVLPELGQSASVCADVAAGLAKDPTLTIRLSIAPAFARATHENPPYDQNAVGQRPSDCTVRVLILIDQMEELWTDRDITQQDREEFLSAVEALAKSGHVDVLATLRSDFYPNAQQSVQFLRLKGQRGHFDLLPPGPSAVARLIVEPARLAGLRFERDESSGRTLDEVILAEAVKAPGALPLLQYTLDELYRNRNQETRTLTFAAFGELGGVEGSLGRRAESLFDGLSSEAKRSFQEILPLLISVDDNEGNSAVRLWAALADLTSTPARKSLIENLISARFITTDRQGDVPMASFAHEALLRRWDQVAKWIQSNRQFLGLRVRLEESQQRWRRQSDESLLLPAGLPLEEARQILIDASYLLSDQTRDFVVRSLDHHAQQEKRRRRRQRTVTSVLAALTLAASAGGVLAWWKQTEAVAARRKAISAQSTAESSELKANVALATSESLRSQIQSFLFRHPDDPEITEVLEQWRQFEASKLAQARTENDERAQAQTLENLAMLGQRSDLNRGTAEQQSMNYLNQSLAIRQRLADDSPKNEFLQRELATTLGMLAEVHERGMNLELAVDYLWKQLQIHERLPESAFASAMATIDRLLAYSSYLSADRRVSLLARKQQLLEASGPEERYAGLRGVALALVAAEQTQSDDTDAGPSSHALFQKLANEFPAKKQAGLDLAYSFGLLGDQAQDDGQPSIAIEQFLEEIAVLERLKLDLREQERLSDSYVRTGDLLVAAGDLPRADAIFQKDYEFWKKCHSQTPDDRSTEYVAYAIGKLAGLAQRQKKYQKAKDLFADAVKYLTQLSERDKLGINATQALRNYQKQIKACEHKMELSESKTESVEDFGF